MRLHPIFLSATATMALLIGASAAGQSQARTASLPNPKQVTVTVVSVDASPLVYLTTSVRAPAGQNHDALLLAALLKDGAQETQYPVITTSDGVAGRVDLISESSGGPPAATTTSSGAQTSSLTLDNRLEFTSHTHTDGTITIALKVQRMSPIFGLAAPAATTSTLSTTRIVHAGQETVLDGSVDSTGNALMIHLTFVKVTVAPL